MSETGNKNLNYLKELFGEIIGGDASWNSRRIGKNDCTRGDKVLIRQERGDRYFLNGDIAGSPFLGKASIVLGKKEDGGVCLAELDGYKIDTELSDIVALCMREESRNVNGSTIIRPDLLISLRKQEARIRDGLKKHSQQQTPNNYPILLSLTNLALLRAKKDDEFQGIVDKISNLGKEDIEFIIELLKDSYSLRDRREQQDDATTRYDPGVCLDGIAKFIVEKGAKKGELRKDFEDWATKLNYTGLDSHITSELMGVIKENKGKIRIKEQSESAKQTVNPSFKFISGVEQSDVDAQQPVALEPSTDSSVINVSNREQTLNTTLLEKMTALETRIEEQNKLIKEQGELIKNLLSVLKLNKDMVVSNISSAADDLDKFAPQNDKEKGTTRA